MLRRFIFWLLGEPDVDIGPGYLHRWFLLPRNRFFNIYLHRFLAPDRGDLHDHPWDSVSLCLKGAMREQTLGGYNFIRPGTVVFRRSSALHRIDFVAGTCWTILVTGPRKREWGFLAGNRWIPWHRYHIARTADRVG